ncbi:hypothetical protein C8T65DRAFT_295822 [Cerioporus squamosus]|nr:hypothetical protein C8T65DRAFT_295822 [Cerioporus squamosus]
MRRRSLCVYLRASTTQLPRQPVRAMHIVFAEPAPTAHGTLRPWRTDGRTLFACAPGAREAAGEQWLVRRRSPCVLSYMGSWVCPPSPTGAGRQLPEDARVCPRCKHWYQPSTRCTVRVPTLNHAAWCTLERPTRCRWQHHSDVGAGPAVRATHDLQTGLEVARSEAASRNAASRAPSPESRARRRTYGLTRPPCVSVRRLSPAQWSWSPESRVPTEGGALRPISIARRARVRVRVRARIGIARRPRSGSCTAYAAPAPAPSCPTPHCSAAP